MCQKCEDMKSLVPAHEDLYVVERHGNVMNIREPRPAEIMVAAAMLCPQGTNLRAILLSAAKGLLIPEQEDRDMYLTMLDLRLDLPEVIHTDTRVEEIFTPEELAVIQAAIRAAAQVPQEKRPPVDPRAN